MTATPRPTEINLHQKSHILEIAFDDGARFELPYEFLRVYSPSAEVQGHGPGQGVLQLGIRSEAMQSSPISMTATIPASTPGKHFMIWARIRKPTGPFTCAGWKRPGTRAGKLAGASNQSTTGFLLRPVCSPYRCTEHKAGFL
jgi:hypothetical protein